MTQKAVIFVFLLFFIVLPVNHSFAGTVDERTMNQIENISDDKEEEPEAEELKKEQGQKLNDEWVYPGMSPKKVQEAWGEPAYIETQYSDGIDERWIYYGLGKKYTVEFDNDEVSNIFAE